MTTVTIGGGTYTVPLPLRPADEAAATPDERFTIALDAVDAELAANPGASYGALRRRVAAVTGLSWAPVALAIRHRRP